MTASTSIGPAVSRAWPSAACRAGRSPTRMAGRPHGARDLREVDVAVADRVRSAVCSGPLLGRDQAESRVVEQDDRMPVTVVLLDDATLSLMASSSSRRRASENTMPLYRDIDFAGGARVRSSGHCGVMARPRSARDAAGPMVRAQDHKSGYPAVLAVREDGPGDQSISSGSSSTNSQRCVQAWLEPRAERDAHCRLRAAHSDIPLGQCGRALADAMSRLGLLHRADRAAAGARPRGAVRAARER